MYFNTKLTEKFNSNI